MCRVLNTYHAGVGLEFTAASAVVFVELPDEVSILLQAEDRAHRHGQQMAVNIYFLLARGTSDERKCVSSLSSPLHRSANLSVTLLKGLRGQALLNTHILLTQGTSATPRWVLDA